MKFVLNLLPLKVGGGVQVALDFIRNIQNQAPGKAHQWVLVATDNTPFAAIKPSHNLIDVRIIKDNVASRIWFEYAGCRQLLRDFSPDAIFTLFGVHWWGARDVPQVVGCALPYLAYREEISLWDDENFLSRLRLRLSIWHNARFLQTADAIIFETAVMADRTTKNLGLDPIKNHVVHPTCSSLVQPGQKDSATAERCRDLPEGYRILLLAGHSPHKNIFLLPRIAEQLKDHHGMTDVVFVTTLAKDDPKTKAYHADAEARGVAKMIYNLGPVPQAGCAEVYNAVDAVILPSRVESFSNTVAESWTMEKPLLVSDLDWAREACGEGAEYFTYDDAGSAATTILSVRSDPARCSRLIQAGKRMMQTYPSFEERFAQYLTVIESHGADRREVNV